MMRTCGRLVVEFRGSDDVQTSRDNSCVASWNFGTSGGRFQKWTPNVAENTRHEQCVYVFEAEGEMQQVQVLSELEKAYTWTVVSLWYTVPVNWNDVDDSERTE